MSVPPPTFDNPRLRVVWAAVAVLQPDEAIELTLALEKLLGRGAFPSTRQKDRIADALACLRQVAELLGKSPSVRDYEAVRSERPELELIASGSIRTRLSSGWNDCLRRAQLEVIADGDVPLRKRNVFTEQEIVAALQECHRDLGQIPTLYTYRLWAQRPDVLARPGNRPETYAPMMRVFGGFPAALRAAGIVGDAIQRNGHIAPTEWAYDEEEFLDALRNVSKRLGHSPTRLEYDAERRKIAEEQIEAGVQPTALPSLSSIHKRYRYWSCALDCAGLPPAEHKQGPKPGPTEPRYTSEQILGWIREAYAEVGEPFTGVAYDGWRRARLGLKSRGGIAGSLTAAKRFGSWAKAVERAFDRTEKSEQGERPNAAAA